MTTYICPKCRRESEEKGFCPRCKVLLEKVCPVCREPLPLCTCTGEIAQTKGHRRTNIPL